MCVSAVAHPYVCVCARATTCVSPESNPLCFLRSSLSDELICSDWLGKDEMKGGENKRENKHASQAPISPLLLPRDMLPHSSNLHSEVCLHKMLHIIESA